jgi:hypothetical protein
MKRRNFIKQGALWVPTLLLSRKSAGQFGLQSPGFVGQLSKKNTAVATSYLLEENCEGAGTPAGWGDAGTPDWDYTTTILQGSHSIDLGTGDSTGATISDGSPLYVYFLFRMRASLPASATQVFGLRTSGDSALCLFRIGTDAGSRGKITVFANGSDSTATVTAMSTSTTYHCWMTWAASGTCSAAFSTDGVRPTSGDQFTSKTGGTGAVDKLVLAASFGAIYDRILIDDAQIGDNP